MSKAQMPMQLCPRCQRTNPPEAIYCFQDGTELRGGSLLRGGELGREFIFPTGRRCKTYDDFAAACSENWNAARDLLRQGGIRQFFAGIGRMDIAMLAEKGASQPDLDIALDEFIGKLPTRDAPGPRLDIMPRRLNLGRLKVGESRQYQLRIINQGVRLLHGTLNVDGDDWINLGHGVSGPLPIKTGKQQQLTLSVDTVGLVAGQKYASKLTVITNGGVAEVPVTMEVAAVPFTLPPLQGAANPRELAARMRDHPKLAPPLLESGEVERWFQSNGWSYPIQGAGAKGVASVQQFFEGLGLSKPPRLEVSDQEVLMITRSGRNAAGFVTIKTPAKKWVYARVESDTPWLTVAQSDVGGAQEARIDFTASGRSLEGNQRYQGELRIVANGGQRFTVKVWNEVRVPQVSPMSRILAGLAIGAASGLLYRLLICGCAAIALLLGWLVRGGEASDWDTLASVASGGWLRKDDAAYTLYLRYLSVASGLVGLVLGAFWLSSRGNRRDALAGALVGATAFLAVGATAAILLEVFDKLVGWVLPFGWPMVAVAGWTLWGGLIGLVCSLLGKPGMVILAKFGKPVLWLAGKVGLSEKA